MKKIFTIVLAMSLLIALVPSMAIAATEDDPRDNGYDRLYKFNIIGVDNQKNNDVMENNGKRIFVDLYGPSAIYLVKSGEEGSPAEDLDPNEFAILDANGTDDDGALFAMPDPGLDPYNITTGAGKTDTMSAYSIFIRSLGKPGGAANITTCADLLDSTFGGLLSNSFVKTLNRAGAYGGLASVEQVPQSITARPKGKSNFYNVTAELLTIVFKVEVTDGTTTWIEYVRVPIFDDMLENEYWEYNNNGLKNLQVWIYAEPTDVSENDGPYLPD
jgi:hypothetical protein